MRAAITLLSVLAVTGGASAQVVYTSQTRTVSAGLFSSFGGVHLTDMQSAPNFMDWNGFANVPTSPFGGFANSRQISSLAPGGVHIESSMLSVQPSAMGTGEARAESILDVTFDVLTNSTFTLMGEMAEPSSNSVPISVNRLVYLTGPGVNIMLGGVTPYPSGQGPGAFNLGGVMVPGSYHLVIDGGSYASTSAAGAGNPLVLAGFHADLVVVPAPAGLGVLCLVMARAAPRRRATKGAC